MRKEEEGESAVDEMRLRFVFDDVFFYLRACVRAWRGERDGCFFRVSQDKINEAERAGHFEFQCVCCTPHNERIHERTRHK